MYLRSSSTLLFVFVLTFLTSAVFAQTTSKISKKQKKTPTREIQLQMESDERTRNSPGEREREGRRESRRRTATRSQALSQKDQDGDKDPKVSSLVRAGSFAGDLRSLPYEVPIQFERPEREDPFFTPGVAPAPPTRTPRSAQQPSLASLVAAAPTPSSNFPGLDFATFGNGHPPDTNGDVGPTYYIQSINTSLGIFDKATGARVVGVGFNTFMCQGAFGNLCDTNNFGDPVVLYDTFEDRWIITDFAFTLDAGGNVTSNSFQCFAVSKTGDPVSGGWNFYFTVDTDFLGDYPKFGVWPDGIYWSANMFGKPAGGAFANARVKAMNKAQMYAGSPTVQVITFNAPSNDFALLPSNARLQTGTPPTGRPNLYVSTELFLNAVSVYKFHVDFAHPTLSTFTGPDNQLAPNCWPNATPANAATTANAADVLAIRAMMQNQYSNIGGAESLWVSHTVQRNVSATNTTCNATTGGNAAPRWYQLNVTGGTVAANVAQGNTFDPEGANTFFRYMPSIAVDRLGDMAMGYSKSNSTTNPQIKYAGRLAGDPVNTITQTEQTLVDGTGSQSGSCGGTCTRWGDYSAMSLDPDGCTFWYTNMYYITSGLNHQTRIGAFAYPSCTAFANNGSLSGTVTSAVTGVPLPGATVTLGSRSTTTNASGNYSFTNLPQGVYPTASASLGGYVTNTVSNISVTDNNLTTQNFSLTTAIDQNCFSDTTQSDFQAGTPTNTELTTSPGDVKLSLVGGEATDQVSSPASFFIAGNLTATSWNGQTFRAGATGNLTKMTIGLGLATGGTSGTITVEIRDVNGSNPGTNVLATASAGPVTNVNSVAVYTVTFATPAAVVSGNSYSFVLRTSVGSTVFGVRGNTDTLANGQFLTTANSGTTWTPQTTDLFFTTFVTVPPSFSASGDFVSNTKDSNPAVSGTTSWGNIGWNATVPANTAVKLQVAASNNQFGPFNFVGPDGTAGTFFASGASLAQFNGLRYLKYKATLTTTNGAVTPALSDVSFCFTNPRVWTGAVSNDWNNGANWSSSGTPGASDSAVIPSTGVLNDPFNTTNASVGSLQIGTGRIIDTGPNTLTVTTCSPTAVTGGNSTSFVKGNLTRCVNGSGAYVFPVGTANGFSPVSLTGIVGTGNFNVIANQAFLTGTDTTKSIQRNWGLTPLAGVTQANITLTYLDADVPGTANEANFRFTRRNGLGTASFTPSVANTATNTFTLNNVTAFSTWSLGVLVPTAAPASISGRVLTSTGRSIPNAIVTLTDASGVSRTARSNTFGYYTFSNVQSGQSYILQASARLYTFAPRAINLTDDLTGFDITAEP